MAKHQFSKDRDSLSGRYGEDRSKTLYAKLVGTVQTPYSLALLLAEYSTLEEALSFASTMYRLDGAYSDELRGVLVNLPKESFKSDKAQDKAIEIEESEDELSDILDSNTELKQDIDSKSDKPVQSKKNTPKSKKSAQTAATTIVVADVTEFVG